MVDGGYVKYWRGFGFFSFFLKTRHQLKIFIITSTITDIYKYVPSFSLDFLLWQMEIIAKSCMIQEVMHERCVITIVFSFLREEVCSVQTVKSLYS